jgi:hypothetical protein
MTTIPTPSVGRCSTGEKPVVDPHPQVEEKLARAVANHGLSTYPQPLTSTTTVQGGHQKKQGRTKGARQSRA